ncbi:MAG: glycyl-radical enzyme activating protein [Melioribacteraceae bacterium]|nr:glycyl-radical enzyme activating protein [Melioribacteraceae bacterium]
MNSGLIFDVKRYAINDGPGIRITFFFKGCSLNCAWCHNPESISKDIQKMYSADKCIGCGTCVDECPKTALTLTERGIITNSELCNMCGICAEVCPTGAIEMSGRMETVDDIMKMIENEQIFFDQSGGGVTFSGGEPILHYDVLIDLLDKCGERGIHRTVDTAGLVGTEKLLEVAKRTDLFLYDLKMIDEDKHKRWTDVSNKKILENLQKLSKTGAEINIRIPLIKGVNTDDENIVKTAEYVSSLAGKKKKVNLLPYHNIAQKKYTKLGEEYDESGMGEPGKELIDSIVAKFNEYEIEVVVGG